MMPTRLHWILPTLFALVPAAGCSTPNSNFCDSETPCEDPARPFCDLEGIYGSQKTCVAAPDGGTVPSDVDGGDPTSGELTLEVLPTSVRDERMDEITFNATNGAPTAFAHNGPAVTLGGEGECPVVYKHAVLLRDDVSATESPANPLSFHYRVSAPGGVKLSAVSYRVTPEGGDNTQSEWLPAVPGETTEGGVEFFAPLTRTALPLLATYEGSLEVELRGADLDGNEVIATRCIDYRPLAGPLLVGAAVKLETSASSLAKKKLDLEHAISGLLNGTSNGSHLFQVTLKNGTDDPIKVDLENGPTSGTCQKKWQRWYVRSNVEAGSKCLSSPTACAEPVLPSSNTYDQDSFISCSPSLASAETSTKALLLDDQFAVIPGNTIPPRSTAIVRVSVHAIPGLQPRKNSEAASTYREDDVYNEPAGSFISFTGKTEGEVEGCDQTGSVSGVSRCMEWATYTNVRALTEVSVTFKDLEVGLGLSVGGGATTYPPTDQDDSPGITSYTWETTDTIPDA